MVTRFARADAQIRELPDLRESPEGSMRQPQDRRYLGGSASLFGITWKLSVAIFCGQGFWSSVE